MPYKPSKEAIVIAVVYLCLMLWTAANELLDAQSSANKTLATLLMSAVGLGFLLFMDSELPPQFTPLHRLSLLGKIWRIVVAVLAVLFGGVLTVTGLYRIGHQPSVSSSAFLTLCAAILYAGIRMLRAR